MRTVTEQLAMYLIPALPKTQHESLFAVVFGLVVLGNGTHLRIMLFQGELG
jgi:hypothetical protein